MKHNIAFGLLLIAIFSISNGEAQQHKKTAQSVVKKNKWKLVWADEFNYNGIPDTSKWGWETGNSGWGNEELQNYTGRDTSTASVRNGILRITANKLISADKVSYTSARLLTRHKAAWKYGRIEVKARVASGLGICSAIWMMPSDCGDRGGWPACGEIDIMEHIGWESHKDSIFQTAHTGAYNHIRKTQKGARTYIPAPFSDFHIYAMEWNPDGLDYYIDGTQRYHFPNEHKTSAEWPFDAEFFLIMNISVGGKWEGAFGIDPTIFPATMEVDYVRAYKDTAYPTFAGR